MLTFPGFRTSYGRTDTGLSGVFAKGNRRSILLPLGLMFLTGLANAAIIGPLTTKVKDQREAQGQWLLSYESLQPNKTLEEKDGKKSYDPPPHSQRMIELNKNFGTIHGISSVTNLVNLVASIVYGFTLAALM